MEKIQIKNATKKDLPALCEMQKELADYHHKIDKTFRSGKSMGDSFCKYISSKIGKRGEKILVAFYDGKAVGYFYANLKKNSIAFKMKTIGHISDVYVKKEYRSKGVGRALMKETDKWFIQQGARYVDLSVDLRIQPSFEFYKKNGFKILSYKMRKKL